MKRKVFPSTGLTGSSIGYDNNHNLQHLFVGEVVWKLKPNGEARVGPLLEYEAVRMAEFADSLGARANIEAVDMGFVLIINN